MRQDEGDGLERGFSDIKTLAERCRYDDCHHQSEPGCAVQRAVVEGELAIERLESYFRLERELAYNESRHDEAKRRQEGRKLSVLIREHSKRSQK